jgi:hypothetical protein
MAKSEPPELPLPKGMTNPDYEWPVIEPPDHGAIALISQAAAAQGGRAIKEAHADRFVTMKLPTGDGDAMVQRKVARCECRRRALVAVPVEKTNPVVACIICDSIHRWPTAGVSFPEAA